MASQAPSHSEAAEREASTEESPKQALRGSALPVPLGSGQGRRLVIDVDETGIGSH